MSLFSPKIFILCLGGFVSFSVYGQVGVEISLERPDFLLYEPIEVKVRLSNALPEPLDMTRMSGGEPWLDFYVTTAEDEEIERTDRTWTPTRMILLSGQKKSVSVNLLPLFLIREPGKYRVSARVTLNGRHINSSTAKFSVVNGVTIWKQQYTAPPDSSDSSKKIRPRFYSLLVHRIHETQVLYARIQNLEEQRIYCTTSLGNMVSYGEPQARVDLHGNFHVFHQSGTRIFNYSHFSPSGKRLGIRYFSNISSTPLMVTLEKNETEVIGGEEIFIDRDRKQQVIPTPPVVRIPR